MAILVFWLPRKSYRCHSFKVLIQNVRTELSQKSCELENIRIRQIIGSSIYLSLYTRTC